MNRRRFLSGVGSSGGSDVVYGNQIVAHYEVTDDTYYEKFYEKYRLTLIGSNMIEQLISIIDENGNDIIHTLTNGVYKYYENKGVYKYIFVFKNDCDYLSALFANNVDLIYVDMSNFNSSIVTDFRYAFNYTPKLKEIVGTIYLDSTIYCNCIFGGMVSQHPPISQLSCVNFGKQENIIDHFNVFGANISNLIWREVFVKGAFDRKSAGYADHLIGYFSNSSFMTEEEQAIVRAKGYTWDYD